LTVVINPSGDDVHGNAEAFAQTPDILGVGARCLATQGVIDMDSMNLDAHPVPDLDTSREEGDGIGTSGNPDQ
jgi:hypothetical protein